jgi:hypothetical protein
MNVSFKPNLFRHRKAASNPRIHDSLFICDRTIEQDCFLSDMELQVQACSS